MTPSRQFQIDTNGEYLPTEKMHDIRIKIDGLLAYVNDVKNDVRPEYSKGKREMALAYTKLQEAKMWMGKVLEEMGSELPKEFRDKANEQ